MISLMMILFISIITHCCWYSSSNTPMLELVELSMESKIGTISAKSIAPFFFTTIEWNTPSLWNCNATSV